MNDEKRINEIDFEIISAYEKAKEIYMEFDVDTEKALEKLSKIPISLHCWQGDDVSGFETPDSSLSGGGIQATGNYPGKARNIDELQQDYRFALSLIPGNHRINIHAIYGDFKGKKVDRNEISYENFEPWVNWAQKNNVKIDFNATLFSHPKASGGFTLSHPDREIRDFWIEHVKRAREISAQIGKQQDSPCIHNLWIPDGAKDHTISEYDYRKRLKESLDEIYKVKYSNRELLDSIEGKLFGIGSEFFVVGSHEFYYGYALKKNLLLTLDMGHYHPTESVADKISAMLQYFPELLLHISRGVRWDSDHVVLQSDDVQLLLKEIVRANALDKVHLALDYFDASINRIGAWVIGMRSTLRSLLFALLEPKEQLTEYENAGKNFQKLALLETCKTLPWGAVWNYYCAKNGVPIEKDWVKKVENYEKEVLSKR